MAESTRSITLKLMIEMAQLNNGIDAAIKKVSSLDAMLKDLGTNGTKYANELATAQVTAAERTVKARKDLSEQTKKAMLDEIDAQKKVMQLTNQEAKASADEKLKISTARAQAEVKLVQSTAEKQKAILNDVLQTVGDNEKKKLDTITKYNQQQIASNKRQAQLNAQAQRGMTAERLEALERLKKADADFIAQSRKLSEQQVYAAGVDGLKQTEAYRKSYEMEAQLFEAKVKRIEAMRDVQLAKVKGNIEAEARIRLKAENQIRMAEVASAKKRDQSEAAEYYSERGIKSARIGEDVATIAGGGLQQANFAGLGASIGDMVAGPVGAAIGTAAGGALTLLVRSPVGKAIADWFTPAAEKAKKLNADIKQLQDQITALSQTRATIDIALESGGAEQYKAAVASIQETLPTLEEKFAGTKLQIEALMNVPGGITQDGLKQVNELLATTQQLSQQDALAKQFEVGEQALGTFSGRLVELADQRDEADGNAAKQALIDKQIQQEIVSVTQQRMAYLQQAAELNGQAFDVEKARAQVQAEVTQQFKATNTYIDAALAFTDTLTESTYNVADAVATTAAKYTDVTASQSEVEAANRDIQETLTAQQETLDGIIGLASEFGATTEDNTQKEIKGLQVKKSNLNLVRIELVKQIQTQQAFIDGQIDQIELAKRMKAEQAEISRIMAAQKRGEEATAKDLGPMNSTNAKANIEKLGQAITEIDKGIAGIDAEIDSLQKTGKKRSEVEKDNAKSAKKAGEDKKRTDAKALKDAEDAAKDQKKLQDEEAKQAEDAIKKRLKAAEDERKLQAEQLKALEEGSQKMREINQKMSELLLGISSADTKDLKRATDLWLSASQRAANAIKAEQDRKRAELAQKAKEFSMTQEKLDKEQTQLNTLQDLNAELKGTQENFKRFGQLFEAAGFKVPGFAEGGVVPGAKGAPVLSIVHGGEGILTTKEMDQLPHYAKGTGVKDRFANTKQDLADQAALMASGLSGKGEQTTVRFDASALSKQVDELVASGQSLGDALALVWNSVEKTDTNLKALGLESEDLTKRIDENTRALTAQSKVVGELNAQYQNQKVEEFTAGIRQAVIALQDVTDTAGYLTPTLQELQGLYSQIFKTKDAGDAMKLFDEFNLKFQGLSDPNGPLSAFHLSMSDIIAQLGEMGEGAAVERIGLAITNATDKFKTYQQGQERLIDDEKKVYELKLQQAQADGLVSDEEGVQLRIQAEKIKNMTESLKSATDTFNKYAAETKASTNEIIQMAKAISELNTQGNNLYAVQKRLRDLTYATAEEIETMERKQQQDRSTNWTAERNQLTATLDSLNQRFAAAGAINKQAYDYTKALREHEKILENINQLKKDGVITDEKAKELTDLENAAQDKNTQNAQTQDAVGQFQKIANAIMAIAEIAETIAAAPDKVGEAMNEFGKVGAVSEGFSQAGDITTQVGQALMSAFPGTPLGVAGAILVGVGMISKAIAKIVGLFKKAIIPESQLAQQRAAAEQRILDLKRLQIDAIDKAVQLGNVQLDQARERLKAEQAIQAAMKGQSEYADKYAGMTDQQIQAENERLEQEKNKNQALLDQANNLLQIGDRTDTGDFLRAQGFSDTGSNVKQLKKFIDQLEAGITDINAEQEYGNSLLDDAIALRELEKQVLDESINLLELRKRLGADELKVLKQQRNLQRDALNEQLKALVSDDKIKKQLTNMFGGDLVKQLSDTTTLSTQQMRDLLLKLTEDIDESQISPAIQEIAGAWLDSVDAIGEYTAAENDLYDRMKNRLELQRSLQGSEFEPDTITDEQYFKKMERLLRNRLQTIIDEGEQLKLQGAKQGTILDNELQRLEVENEIYNLMKEQNGELGKTDDILSDLIRKDQSQVRAARLAQHGGTFTAQQRAQIQQTRDEMAARLAELGKSPEEIQKWLSTLPQFATGGINTTPGAAMLHGTPARPEYILNSDAVRRVGLKALDAANNGQYLGQMSADKFLSASVERQWAMTNVINEIRITNNQVNHFAPGTAAQVADMVLSRMEPMIYNTVNKGFREGKILGRKK